MLVEATLFQLALMILNSLARQLKSVTILNLIKSDWLIFNQSKVFILARQVP